jgi:hypothetical protein
MRDTSRWKSSAVASAGPPAGDGRRLPAACAVRGQAGRLGVQQGQAGLDVFDPLAGDVADLQGGQAAADLLLDVASQGGDADRDARRSCRDGRRWRWRWPSGRRARPAAGRRNGAPDSSSWTSAPRSAPSRVCQVVAEGVQLGAAQLDHVADLLGEDRELGTGRDDAAGGDLDVDGEDPEIGQVLAHLLDAGGQAVADLDQVADRPRRASRLSGQADAGFRRPWPVRRWSCGHRVGVEVLAPCGPGGDQGGRRRRGRATGRRRPPGSGLPRLAGGFQARRRSPTSRRRTR